MYRQQMVCDRCGAVEIVESNKTPMGWARIDVFSRTVCNVYKSFVLCPKCIPLDMEGE